MVVKFARSDDDDLIRAYFSDISQFGLLTKEDEARLGREIQAGLAAKEELDSSSPDQARKRELQRLVRKGDAATRNFVQSNLRLVVAIAKKYRSSGVPLADIIQEGNLGLIHAVEKFDYRKGFKFSTYASWWIRQSITRGISYSARTIRLPGHAGETLARVMKAQSLLDQRYGRQATLSELAQELDLPEETVADVLRYPAEPLSLSEPIWTDDDTELGDVVEDRNAVSPFEAAAANMLPDEIVRLFAPLNEKEREVLSLCFGLDRGEPRTLEEVGEYFNLTRERVRQISSRAMCKLRHPSVESGAKDLLSI